MVIILKRFQRIPSNYQSFLFISIHSNTSNFNYPLNPSVYKFFSYIYEPLIIENVVTGELEADLA
ncbi:MAG: hypothetical protein MK289_06810 [Trichodesmium sp. ALOHA_ZT_67]|uniref:hypothetical protein n=1 Tax=Trichodesmium erythraeum TaxID=1206 RepID=UPI00003C9C2F|nr:hypothetical protein [Trichodesmium erythraeum GBRTRLIN201]MCH2048185.1 hypothetical protein [Trichodesmium sp. ALOHA_ZT_67]MCL2929468.1 hypothetical protein [Trichodesmium sp. MAG_R01]MDE5096757.1 hypothetical protein [Trichodesmium sp. St11_bin5]MDT9339440.1 hypothetical protein [Trichodesmium erythraeum 21-75]